MTGQGLVKKVAGLSAVSIPGVEDVDLSDVVKVHADYMKSMDKILKLLNVCCEEQ